MPEDFPSFEPPTPFPPWQRRAVPEFPGNVSSESAPTRPVTPVPDVPELDFDQSTVSESDGPETDFDDGPETDDEDDDSESESDDQDDDFESEDDGYDSGYEAGSEFESDDEEYDDDDSEEEEQDFDESDDEDLSALELCLNKLHLLMLEVEKYEARIAVRTESENDVSHDSDVDPAPGGFMIDVSHLNVHNELPPRSAAGAGAVSPRAGQQKEPVPCAIPFSWWLIGRKHAKHRVPLLFYVLACDVVAVLAGAALYATFQAAARALFYEPGTITRPVNDFPVAWLAYAPLVTVISVALDAVVARVCERVLRVRGCRVWAALPVFRLRRQWAGARRQFVNVSFSLFAVQTLAHAAVCSFCITACC